MPGFVVREYDLRQIDLVDEIVDLGDWHRIDAILARARAHSEVNRDGHAKHQQPERSAQPHVTNPFFAIDERQFFGQLFLAASF